MRPRRSSRSRHCKRAALYAFRYLRWSNPLSARPTEPPSAPEPELRPHVRSLAARHTSDSNGAAPIPQFCVRRLSPVSPRVATVPRVAWSPPAPRRVRALRDRLRLLFRRAGGPPHGKGLEELILTVLSQSTNDRNRDVAYLRLRARLPAWEQVRDAPLEEVEAAIQPGGLHRQKSVRIQEILRTLGGWGPIPDLSFLGELPVEEARAYLVALPGVGRKTAACVLLFAFGLPDVPVDTHVSRVGTRLGLFRPGAPFEELHDEMLRLTPAGGEVELHINLLRHGRRTCHAQRPACGECALLRMCPWGRERTSTAAG